MSKFKSINKIKTFLDKYTRCIVILIWVIIFCLVATHVLGYITSHNQMPHNENLIIVFSAKWCQPCRKMKTEVWDKQDIKDLIKEYKIDWYYFDYDKDKKWVKEYRIVSIPTVIFGKRIKDNKVNILKRTHYLPKVMVKKHIRKFYKKEK